jgi:hypothetical protein
VKLLGRRPPTSNETSTFMPAINETSPLAQAGGAASIEGPKTRGAKRKAVVTCKSHSSYNAICILNLMKYKIKYKM